MFLVPPIASYINVKQLFPNGIMHVWFQELVELIIIKSEEDLGGGESDCTSNFEHKQPIMMQ